jgi:hypothetical protein
MNIKRLFLLGLFFSTQISSFAANSALVGAWQYGDGAANASGVVVFLNNGIYFHAEDTVESVVDFDGMERGTYTWDETTGELDALAIVDTNGEIGLSESRFSNSFTATIAGDSLVINDDGERFTLGRVFSTTNPIVGGWEFGDGAFNDSGIVVFLPNGFYFHIEDTNDADGKDGMERGTYTWIESTGIFTATPQVDTNGDIGLNDPLDSVLVNGDVSTWTDSEESGTLNRVVSLPSTPSPTSPLVGAWQYGDGAANASGVFVFLSDGIFFTAVDEVEIGLDFDGMERGTYTWNEATGELNATTLVDTNGELGIQEPEHHDHTVTVTGDSLEIITHYGDGDESFTLQRVVSTDSPIVGGWHYRNIPGEEFESGIVVLLSNGIYFQTEDLLNDDPNDIDGMERGTYTWNETTGAFTAVVLVDTNGVEIGLNEPLDSIFVVGDILTWSDSDGSGTLNRVTNSPANPIIITPLVGAWQIGDGARNASGILVFLNNGIYFYAEDADETAGFVDSMEKGTYTWNETTGAFTPTTTLKTHSDDANVEAGTVTINGDLLTWNDGDGTAQFNRVYSTTNPIVGGWQFGDGAGNNSGVAVLLDNGIFFIAEDTDENAFEFDGIERGTYTWDPSTGALGIPSIAVDTNGENGVSHPIGEFFFTIAGDQAVVRDDEDSTSLSRVTFIAGSSSIAPVVDGKITITFEGVLQESTTLFDWQDVDPQPVSPWELTPGVSQRFFVPRGK